MITPNVHPTPEQLHPSLWRASQLARSVGHSIDTGYAALSKQLPDNGWPTGAAIELLLQQSGSGEIKILAPALKKVQQKKVIFLQPPYTPNALAFAGLGIKPDELFWLKSKTTADALWAAETILKSGCCGALLFWNTHVRPESLRRLNLAAQAGQTLFFVLRPISATQDASPSPLRLSIRPAFGGVNIEFIKRKGPQSDVPLFLPFNDSTGKILRPNNIPEPIIAVPSKQTTILTRHNLAEIY
jgi:protein ImuA